jgi:hypothetical protein
MQTNVLALNLATKREGPSHYLDWRNRDDYRSSLLCTHEETSPERDARSALCQWTKPLAR